MNKFNGAVAIIAVVALLLGGYAATHSGLAGNGSDAFGATSAGGLLAENYIPYVMYTQGYSSAKNMNIPGDFTLGSSGTTMTQIIKGTCALIVQVGTFLASSTTPFDCAVTGAVSGDVVLMQWSTSTPGLAGDQWIIMGSKASSTSGFVTADVFNAGAVGNPSKNSIASSAAYIILR